MKNLTRLYKKFDKSLVIFALLFIITISRLSAQTDWFDKAKWDNDIKYRKKIAKSADMRKFVIGKTNKEIIDLLGEPEKKEEVAYIYCLDKKIVLIADCKDVKEKCYLCNSSALTIIFSDSVVLDIIEP